VSVDGFPLAEPGQFVQIDCHRSKAAESPRLPRLLTWTPGQPVDPIDEFCRRETMLRRPFSIGGLERRGHASEIDIIGRAIGPGTDFLASMKPGEQTEILGPLGRPFVPVEGVMVHVLVAGGVGLPPLLWLSDRMQRERRRATAICGARTRDLLPLTITSEPDAGGRETMCADEFTRSGAPTIITSDDGSIGMKGTTADALSAVLDRLGRGAAVYTCGPEPMMRRIAEICAARGVACRAALERVMGCGMGTCQSCVVPIRDETPRGWHYELCCTHGPVFDAASIAWEMHA